MNKRILVLLTVVALMVVMLAMSVAPAFAGPKRWKCTNPSGVTFSGLKSGDVNKLEKLDQGWVCVVESPTP
jgi:hypothetical protein